MKTPIDALLDKVDWRCTVCNTPTRIGCGCWVKLQCTRCGKERGAPKDKTDPKGTKLIRMLCPECAGGDRSLIDYFDKDGKQLWPK